ncbi:MAG TPA: ribosome biogenesis GTPase Der [Holophaga sp.]|nr:ribosome biogenesis GTPase Der [Holophaga sp.]HPS66238.1 ribosome biogenesis GTPase Der [Holophaga sp.]
MKLPIVALCGRPNVGKSTLYNRLTRSREALVHDLPGMTRDRTYGRVVCSNEAGEPEEIFELVDTGGLDFDGEDVITRGITRLSQAAMDEAHVLVLIVDAHDGWNPGDAEIAGRIRALGKPSILAINKIDGVKGGSPDGTFYGLGFDEVHVISAAHGSNVPDLLASIRARLPFHRSPEEAEQHDPGDELRLAIIGRPNVGKSSLCNKLLGYERSLVSEVAGTTRDTVDTVFRVEDRVYRLIDTAGIRRKGKTSEGAEILSILKAKQAMARADVSLLLLDAVEGVTHQDAVIAGYAQDAGAAVILAVNKWDKIPKDTYTSLQFEEKMRFDLGFLAHAPMIFISALTGQRVSRLFTMIDEVAEAHARRIPTARLNQFLREAVAAMSPHAVDGKIPKLYFMTQVGVRPPTFVIKANTDRGLHFSYMRFLENRMRQEFGFKGTPIRLNIQKKHRDEDGPKPEAAVRRILDVGEGLKPGRRRVAEGGPESARPRRRSRPVRRGK